jgi:hypothetical protein
MACWRTFPAGLGFLKYIDADIPVSKWHIVSYQFWIFCAMMMMARPACPALLSVNVPVMQVEISISKLRIG